VKEEKLLAIGEAHLAFIPIEVHESLKASEQFIREPGGSPVNVAVAASKLGVRTEYVGRLGKDPFGDYITKLLPTYGVGTRYLSQTDLAPTHVFFRSQANDGERFLPQSSTADGKLRPDDLNKDWINRGDVIYFSSKPLIQNLSKGAIEKAVNIAGEKGGIVAFAPQLKLDEWPNKILARETVLQSIPYAHLLIVSEKELKFFSGKEDEYLAIKKLFGGKIKCMIILRGHNGITYVTERDKGNIRFTMKEVIDPTGMDDAFIGYLLSDLLQHQVTPDQLSNYFKDTFGLEERLEKALMYRYLNAQKRGALTAMADGLNSSAAIT
jgi:fructokinase